ncbi:unnamed protein product, partial [Adineta steineri]
MASQATNSSSALASLT